MSDANEYNPNTSKEQEAEFRFAAQAMANYLQRWHHPHTHVVIDSMSAEIFEGKKRIAMKYKG